MLPQQLQRAPSAPVSRSLPGRQNPSSVSMDDAEDLGLSKLSVRTPTSASPAPPPLRRGFGQADAARTISDRKTLGSACSESGFTSCIHPTRGLETSEDTILRETLLDSMRKQEGMGGPLLREKHHYGIIAPAAIVTGVESGTALNVIAVGTTWNTRVGPQIRLKHLHIRVFAYYSSNNATLTATTVIPPFIRLVLKRTRLPYVPGTPEAAFAADANPPGNVLQIFSGLGRNLATETAALADAVFSPTSVQSYELLREQTIPQIKTGAVSTEPSGNNAGIATGLTYYNNPRMYQVEFKVRLDCISTYDIAVGASPITNQLDLSNLAIFDAQSALALAYSWDLMFEDVTSE